MDTQDVICFLILGFIAALSTLMFMTGIIG